MLMDPVMASSGFFFTFGLLQKLNLQIVPRKKLIAGIDPFRGANDIGVENLKKIEKKLICNKNYLQIGP